MADDVSAQSRHEKALDSVTRDGIDLMHVPQEMITLEIALVAVTQNGWALRYVPQDLLTYEFWKGWYTTGDLDEETIPEEFRDEIVNPLVKAAV